MVRQPWLIVGQNYVIWADLYVKAALREIYIEQSPLFLVLF